MADSGGIKGIVAEVSQTTGEVVKDVKDSVGQAIEQGAQSVAGTQLTPQQLQQKELDRQKQLAETRRKLKWYQDLAVAQRKVREEEKQKLLQKQQLEEQEKQKKKMEEEQKKQLISSPAKLPTISEAIARTQAERSKGRGVGG
ncbi:hypothetical protein HY383_00370 [Candidatus Daviesbacteria bacterium]|nr:hypothetical protein [Candidatus Daviesbacteria bacterium]